MFYLKHNYIYRWNTFITAAEVRPENRWLKNIIWMHENITYNYITLQNVKKWINIITLKMIIVFKI